jgi:hypothetical protein
MMPCELIRSELGALFECEQRADHVRIRTPFLYPDGDLVDLYWQPVDFEGASPAGRLTDLGETLRWLRTQTAALRRSPKQDGLIDDVCRTHGVERIRGELSVRVGKECPMHDAVSKLSQAAMRVADISFTFRSRSVASVADDVADFLSAREITYERGQRQVGRSGKVWTPDFHTAMPERSALVYVLATGNRSRATSLVEHVVTAWYDLSHLQATTAGLGFVSLFDDSADVWTEEHQRLVGDLSDIAFWSRPDELVQTLGAAA